MQPHGRHAYRTLKFLVANASIATALEAGAFFQVGDVTLIAEWPDEVLDDVGLDARTAMVALTHDPKIDDPALTVALPALRKELAADIVRRELTLGLFQTSQSPCLSGLADDQAKLEKNHHTEKNPQGERQRHRFHARKLPKEPRSNKAAEGALVEKTRR